MNKVRQDDDALEALFAAERATAPDVSDTFMARLMADSEAAVRHPTSEPPLRPAFLGGFKGWFAASGLSGAAILGVWIGFVVPDVISTFTAVTDDVVELYTFLPGADLTALSLSE